MVKEHVAEMYNFPTEISTTAPNMIDAAVAVTAGKLGLASPEQALDALHREQPVALSYFRYQLARQAATTLLRSDDQVVAIYEEQSVPEAEDAASTPERLADPLRLYVLAEQDTAALRALIEALDGALVDAIWQRFQQPVAGLLDVVVVDRTRADLLRPRAYGYRPGPTLIIGRDERESSLTYGAP